MVQFQKTASPARTFRIGTRGSALALAQARIAAARLKEAAPGLSVELVTVVTSGDRDQRSSLAEIGGKGLFIRELEQALLKGAIDAAVHSFKDVTANLAQGLRLSAFLKPESICDVLALREAPTLAALAPGSRIGTGSLRRKALLARLRPDLVIADIRGNIDTRLRKLADGLYDGVMLSEAGLLRLGLEKHATVRLAPETFYPAPGQGVVTLETRCGDKVSHDQCMLAGDVEQGVKSAAEFELLRAVGFDCRAPLGVHTVLDGSTIAMKGFIVKSLQGEFIERAITGSASLPEEAGRRLGQEFLNA